MKKKYKVEFGGAYDNSSYLADGYYEGETVNEVAENIKSQCRKGEWVAHKKKDFDNGKAYFDVYSEDGKECIRIDSLD